jgi:predicted amidohydrolase
MTYWRHCWRVVGHLPKINAKRLRYRGIPWGMFISSFRKKSRTWAKSNPFLCERVTFRKRVAKCSMAACVELWTFQLLQKCTCRGTAQPRWCRRQIPARQAWCRGTCSGPPARPGIHKRMFMSTYSSSHKSQAFNGCVNNAHLVSCSAHVRSNYLRPSCLFCRIKLHFPAGTAN